MITWVKGQGRHGLVARSLRVAVLLGTSTAVFALMGGALSGPSLAGRVLPVPVRAIPLPLPSSELALLQLNICDQYGETSPECLNALAGLSPAAGPGSNGGDGKDGQDGSHGRGGSSGGSSNGSSSGSSGGSSGGGSSELGSDRLGLRKVG
jgi:uncharacterized membrane protein YgcG